MMSFYHQTHLLTGRQSILSSLKTLQTWRALLFPVLFPAFFVLGFRNPASATHIVGGGFEMKSLGNYSYTFQLTLYFDQINGSPGAVDNSITFTVYRKSDNTLVETFVGINLDLANQQVIDYIGSACGTLGSPVQTKVLLYRTTRTLSPVLYNHPQGYYVVWERCCRNDGITNLRFPGQQGQTFYMEFPPIVRNGVPFEDDSPVMQPVGNSLFCINQTSFINFSATDIDGDSLVYDLVAPILSNIADTIDPTTDIASPAPYFSVGWQTGYSPQLQITGNPPLTINPKTGILTLKPNRLGLFVFAVRCSEFRNGVKIGEIRREFQQVVIDCPVNTPPRITLPNPVSGSLLGKNDTLFVSNNTQGRTCINVKVNDLQANQRLTLRAVPVNFTPIAPITGDTVKLVVSASDTARLSFCLPACVGSTRANPFRLRILAFDNGCAGSLFDTLEIFIVLTVPFQPVPKINVLLEDSVQFVPAGSTISFLVNTDVLPGQTNQLRAEGKNSRQIPFSLPSLGMRFPSASGLGPLSREFSWTAPCTPPSNQPLTVWFIANTNFCNQALTLSRPVRFSVLPPRSETQIWLSKTGTSTSNVTWSSSTGMEIQDSLEARNPQSTPVVIRSVASEAVLKSYGIAFSEKSGTSPLKVPISWTPPCGDPNRFPATFRFISQSSQCNQLVYDTLLLRLEAKGFAVLEPNLVSLLTRNGDERNHVVSLKTLGLDSDCPVDFEGFEVFDRWGKSVFSTTDRTFSWPADERSHGTYFYSLKVAGKSWQGWIQLVD